MCRRRGCLAPGLGDGAPPPCDLFGVEFNQGEVVEVVIRHISGVWLDSRCAVIKAA
jgi:hypothetical protein